MKGERHVLSADETVSVCVYVYLCVFEFVPNSILRSPPLSFSLSCFEAAFLRFHLFLDRLINYVLLILGIASKSVGNLIFLYIVNITNFLHGFF